MADPAWVGLIDFTVLLLEKPGRALKARFTENKDYQGYSRCSECSSQPSAFAIS